MTGGPQRWVRGEPADRVAAVLSRGGVVAVPTESSYGLAVDPLDPQAVAAVQRIKRRRDPQPLPVVAPGLAEISALGVRVEGAVARRLTDLWPAALTLLLPFEGRIPAAGGSDRLGVRIPSYPPLRALLEELGRALTATSANRTGAPAIVDPRELSALLAGEDAIVFDDGILAGGEPSTILSVGEGGVELLRRGRYPVERLPAGTLDGGGPEAFSAASVEIPVDESS